MSAVRHADGTEAACGLFRHAKPCDYAYRWQASAKAACAHTGLPQSWIAFFTELAVFASRGQLARNAYFRRFRSPVGPLLAHVIAVVLPACSPPLALRSFCHPAAARMRNRWSRTQGFPQPIHRSAGCKSADFRAIRFAHFADPPGDHHFAGPLPACVSEHFIFLRVRSTASRDTRVPFCGVLFRAGITKATCWLSRAFAA